MDGLIWLLAGAVGVQGAMLVKSIRTSRRRHRGVTAELTAARLGLQRGRSEHARLRAALDGVAEGVVVVDLEGRVIDWNAASCELAGLPRDRSGARTLAEVLPWAPLETALAELQRGDGAAEPIEFEMAGIGAQERDLVVAVRRLDDLGYVIGIGDQSRLKQLESLRRDFVANVSHELKTPLAAIKGFVETLLDDPDMPGETRQRFVDRISVQSERLNSLVGDLLTLSQLDEADGGPANYQPCDLTLVTGETVHELTSLADRKRIELTAGLPDGPALVRAQREGLRQVVSNLVDNAIKYTPEHGRVGVKLTLGAQEVRLEVADTGIGLLPADQERVFERFYRVDGARSRELGGTGLGLSIVKNTVRSIGGEVGVHSAVGRGTTFWVTLPLLKELEGAN